ncbi:MAG: VCBS repeat-containing protein [Bryobacteraceae bacterium]|nr:VCBS repeat-containing protein [Bryobacteraceae bacterium]
MLSLCLLLLAADLRFAPHPIASDLKGGYQVVAADLNHDGRPDLIALASGMTELVWFENPTWQRHVIARGMNRMINLTVIGPAIVVATHFNNNPANSEGRVHLLEPGPDANAEWTQREIDRLPSSHRLRTMTLDGQPVVINAPLADPKSVPPDYRGHIPLVLYRPGVWKREPVSTAEEGVMHGIYVKDGLYTASFLGIHRYRWTKGQWQRQEITRGDPAPWPKSGSSDVAVAKRFIAAIEPWHGAQVVVYEGKQRHVIETGLKEGHTLEVADFDGDGREEILAGDRGPGGGVFVWRRAGKAWQRHTPTGPPIRANSCIAVDLNADRRIDIACIGGETANLVWYENQP